MSDNVFPQDITCVTSPLIRFDERGIGRVFGTAFLDVITRQVKHVMVKDVKDLVFIPGFPFSVVEPEETEAVGTERTGFAIPLVRYDERLVRRVIGEAIVDPVTFDIHLVSIQNPEDEALIQNTGDFPFSIVSDVVLDPTPGTQEPEFIQKKDQDGRITVHMTENPDDGSTNYPEYEEDGAGADLYDNRPAWPWKSPAEARGEAEELNYTLGQTQDNIAKQNLRNRLGEIRQYLAEHDESL